MGQALAKESDMMHLVCFIDNDTSSMLKEQKLVISRGDTAAPGGLEDLNRRLIPGHDGASEFEQIVDVRLPDILVLDVCFEGIESLAIFDRDDIKTKGMNGEDTGFLIVQYILSEDARFADIPIIILSELEFDEEKTHSVWSAVNGTNWIQFVSKNDVKSQNLFLTAYLEAVDFRNKRLLRKDAEATQKHIKALCNIAKKWSLDNNDVYSMLGLNLERTDEQAFLYSASFGPLSRDQLDRIKILIKVDLILGGVFQRDREAIRNWLNAEERVFENQSALDLIRNGNIVDYVHLLDFMSSRFEVDY